MFSNNLQGLTPRVSDVRKLLVSLGTGQYYAMKIFAVKWNIISEINKLLLNDIFAELDGSSGIKNIINHRLNLGGLQVDDTSAKITQKVLINIYHSVKSSFKKMFFQCFQWEFREGDINYFSILRQSSIMHVLAPARFYSFMSFNLDLKDKIAKVS